MSRLKNAFATLAIASTIAPPNLDPGEPKRQRPTGPRPKRVKVNRKEASWYRQRARHREQTGAGYRGCGDSRRKVTRKQKLQLRHDAVKALLSSQTPA